MCFQEYVFSKRKIYNTRFTKYWIIHHGEPLPSPPPEVDASECSGPAVFVNVSPEGGRKIWLWDAGQQLWDAVPVRADEVTTDERARDRVNVMSHVWEARSELNH